MSVIIGLCLLAMFKFLFAAIFLVYSPQYDPLEVFLLLFFSGTFAVIFFYYFSKVVNKFMASLWKKKNKIAIKKLRRIIRIKNKFGFWILVTTYPVTVTIPVGSFIMSRYFAKRKYTITYLLASIFVWSFFPALIKAFF